MSPKKNEAPTPTITISKGTGVAVPAIISGSLNTILPSITGRDNKKLNRLASTLPMPKKRDDVNVIPERLTPGKIAKL